MENLTDVRIFLEVRVFRRVVRAPLVHERQRSAKRGPELVDRNRWISRHDEPLGQAGVEEIAFPLAIDRDRLLLFVSLGLDLSGVDYEAIRLGPNPVGFHG